MLVAMPTAMPQGIKAEDEALNVDCSSVILNRDFEGAYTAKSGTGVDGDRALYEPEGWTLYTTDVNNYDMSVLNASCLQGGLFTAVPTTDGGGKNAYLIRQKWGTSTIGLRQDCGVLSAGYYRLGAAMWLTGAGGTASVWARPATENRSAGSAVAGGAEWQAGNVVFSCNGTDAVTVGVEVVHAENGAELYSGFDNLTLYDVTANRSETELAVLLVEMEKAADKLLAGTLADEGLRGKLADSNDAAKQLDAASAYADLYAAYVTLCNALEGAQQPGGDGVKAITADEADEVPLYDLSGRLVGKKQKGGRLVPGVYVQGRSKVMVR